MHVLTCIFDDCFALIIRVQYDIKLYSTCVICICICLWNYVYIKCVLVLLFGNKAFDSFDIFILITVRNYYCKSKPKLQAESSFASE